MVTALKPVKSDTKEKVKYYLMVKDLSNKSVFELLELIEWIESSRHCLLAITPLMEYLEIKPSPIEQMDRDDLITLVNHLYVTTVSKPEKAREGSIWLQESINDRLHVNQFYNPKLDKPDEHGCFKLYTHSVSVGFPSNNKALEFLNYAYKNKQITCGGLREDGSTYRTSYPFEVKLWGATNKLVNTLKEKG